MTSRVQPILFCRSVGRPDSDFITIYDHRFADSSLGFVSGFVLDTKKYESVTDPTRHLYLVSIDGIVHSWNPHVSLVLCDCKA